MNIDNKIKEIEEELKQLKRSKALEELEEVLKERVEEEDIKTKVSEKLGVDVSPIGKAAAEFAVAIRNSGVCPTKLPAILGATISTVVSMTNYTTAEMILLISECQPEEED